MLGALSEGGFGFGLLVASFWFGFRHGIDWDHIAAITDITSSQERPVRAIGFGTLYVLGHAVVVFALGIIAILIGEELPESVDAAMGRIVGATLILLGVYVFWSLIRHGREFRMRSRWMLVFAGIRSGWWKLRGRRSSSDRGARPRARAGPRPRGRRPSAVDAEDRIAEWHHGHHGRPGHHHHKHPEPDDPFVNYQKGTSFLVGMLHGIGAETPTQILIFTAAAGAGGKAAGIAVLGAFLVGLDHVELGDHRRVRRSDSSERRRTSPSTPRSR